MSFGAVYSHHTRLPRSVEQSAVSKRGQGFLLKGQMLDFLHRLIRRIMLSSSLPKEKDWEVLRYFDISSVEFWDEPSFMEKIEFSAKTMMVAKTKNDVEREKRKRSKSSEDIARIVISGASNPFFDSGRTNVRYVAKDKIKQPSFNSDLVVGIARFDYSVLFILPRLQALEVYRRHFQSFSSRGWLAREMRNIQMDDYV